MSRLEYKHYLLLLLSVVAVFNFLDRSILALAMESIKQDFQLSDSQLGFMSGFAFALFYAVAGIPIARWADKGNRNHIMALTTLLWSGMLVISGFVSSFAQLLLVRVGIAVGESGCVPPAQSLVSDYFARAERPRAMAVYWMSIPMSFVISYLVGGWLIEQYGWRITFMAIGIPGVLLALIVKLTLRECRLEATKTSAEEIKSHPVNSAEVPPLSIVIKTLWAKPAFRHVVMAYCLSNFFGSGIGVWIPAFFIRNHDMSTSELGVWLAFSWGIAGLIFTYLGGYLATRYAPSKEQLQLRWAALVISLCAVSHVICYLSDNKIMALIFVSIVIGCLIPLITGSVYSAIQNLVEERMRAVALAFILLLGNLIGMGLAPMVVGFISDALADSLGKESLRYALLIFSPGYFWCAFHLWKSAETVEGEIGLVEDAAKKAEGSSLYCENKNMPDSKSVVDVSLT